MSVSMNQAVSAIKNMFEQNSWKYQFDEERMMFSTGFKLSKTKLGSMDIRILVRPVPDEPSNCFRINSYGEIDLKADDGCIHQVCEYLTRANFGLNFGNFELDFTDGEIRFKVSYNVKDGMVGFDALDDMVSMPVAMFNRYGNGLLAVSMGMMTPEDAIKQAEGN